jgi:hypothetical protein
MRLWRTSRSGIRDARREREREREAGEREAKATWCAESAAAREKAREGEGDPLLPVLPYLPGFCSGLDGHRAACGQFAVYLIWKVYEIRIPVFSFFFFVSSFFPFLFTGWVRGWGECFFLSRR